MEQYGGAEKVAQELAAVFPDAATACLWNDYPQNFGNRVVQETWLSKTPLRRHKGLAALFMLPAWRHLEVSDVPDWMLCTSHLFAHHAQIKRVAKVPKYVYAYTPARYIWAPGLDRRGDSRLTRLMAKPLQKIDRSRAQEAKAIAAVSSYVRHRIENTWMRDCSVIHPPVDVEYFSVSKLHELTPAEHDLLGSLSEPFLVGASRFIPYKRLDLVIAFGAANRLPVVLAGSGPEESALRELARTTLVPVTFVLKPSHALLRELYAKAFAYVFPAIEDFGIMPVEANASGTPVVASAAGGAAETVAQGVSGVLLEAFSPSEMRTAADSLTSLSASNCQRQAKKFDKAQFRIAVRNWIERQ
ncbi:glycosyltransferase [Arthrobacter sp. ISL-28]|uniref:glycosyltransferase n=1 Tax=Arthrobacter sp. ISL-28 TaxID=2819108 RepID=UPI001BEB980D|nr:glycosyltransferase [Arthrobacter sp. ISL-28]MBT2519648.1 glycosyltransferase [Arthrobacter sp. ISL-28]